MGRALITTTALLLALTACSGEPAPADVPTPASTSAAPTGGTAPGTDLGFGESADLVWQPTSELVGQLELSVDAITERRQSVLDGWARDEAMAAARPYFVTVTLANSGEDDLAGQQVPLYLRDDHGTLGAPWTLGGDFTACQSGPLPTPFAAGAEAQMCLVYLVPDGGRVQDLVFEPTEGYEPITWSGEVDGPPAIRRRTRGGG